MGRRSHLEPKLETRLVVANVAAFALWYLLGSRVNDSQLALGPLVAVGSVGALVGFSVGGWLGRKGGFRGVLEGGAMAGAIGALTAPPVFSLANQLFDPSPAVAHTVRVSHVRARRKSPDMVVFTSPDYPGRPLELMARRAPECVAGSVGTLLVRRGAFGFEWASDLSCTARREP